MLFAMTELIRTALYAHHLKFKDVQTPLCTIKCESAMIHFCHKTACAESAHYNEIDEQFVKNHWADLRHVIHPGLCIVCRPKYVLDELYQHPKVKSATSYRIDSTPVSVLRFIDTWGCNELVYIPEENSAVACALDTDLHELQFPDHMLDYVYMTKDGKFRSCRADDAMSIPLLHPSVLTLPSAMAILSMEINAVQEDLTVTQDEPVAVVKRSDTPILQSIVKDGNFDVLQDALKALDADLPDKLEVILSSMANA